MPIPRVIQKQIVAGCGRLEVDVTSVCTRGVDVTSVCTVIGVDVTSVCTRRYIHDSTRENVKPRRYSVLYCTGYRNLEVIKFFVTRSTSQELDTANRGHSKCPVLSESSRVAEIGGS